MNNYIQKKAYIHMKKGNNKNKDKPKSKSDLPVKICVQCNRPMVWRKSWEKNWDSVKFCSERCRRDSKRKSNSKSIDNHNNNVLMTRNIKRSMSTMITTASIILSDVSPFSELQTSSSLTSISSSFMASANDDVVNIDNSYEWSDSPGFFRRLDESNDDNFYADPKLVEHIDDNAVRLLSQYHEKTIEKIKMKNIQTNSDVNINILDLCSSWVSHIGHIDGTNPDNIVKVWGIGMNEAELKLNPVLSHRIVQNLNLNNRPSLDTLINKSNLDVHNNDNIHQIFDLILLQLSIDYLIHPVEVLKEGKTLLRPEGKIAISFSNRVFITKAIAGWTGKGDEEHIDIVKDYLRAAGFDEDKIHCESLIEKGKGKDPLYVVTATI